MFQMRARIVAGMAATLALASAQAAAATGATSTKAPNSQGGAEGADHASSRTDHVRIGALGSAGFPRPLAIEGLIELERTFAFGVEYGVLPTITVGGVSAEMSSLAADARIFPFRGPFFIGLRAGHQHFDANASAVVDGFGTVSESLEVDTTFLNPRLGFLWTWEPGFSVGINAGVQFPISSTVSSTLPPDLSARLGVLQSVQSVANTTLPTFDLLQVGLLL